MSNPGTSILITSKRFPLVWGELETEVPTWRAMIPETRSPSELGGATEREWVLKSVYGRVGREVAIAGIRSGRGYREAAKKARKNPVGLLRGTCSGMYGPESRPGARTRNRPGTHRGKADILTLTRI